MVARTVDSIASRWVLPFLAPVAAGLLVASCGDSTGPGVSESPPEDAQVEGPTANTDEEKEGLRGHWYRREAKEPTAAERADALEGIGYAPGMEAATSARGIMQYDPDLAENGLNLYSSGHAAEAFLMDMEGRLLHRWTKPIRAIWPEIDAPFGYFRKARLISGGRLLVIFEGKGLAALDKDSNVLWTYDKPAHHDIREDADGTLYGLDRKAKPMPEFHPDRPFLDDRVVFLKPDGKELGHVSVLDCLLRSTYADDVRKIVAAGVARGLQEEEQAKELYKEKLRENPELLKKLDAIGDIFHCNSVRRVGAEEAAAIEGLEEGWYLLSIRNISALVALEIDPDRRTGVARWFARGPWKHQHEAIPLTNGRVLLFDNLGLSPQRSRALELVPSTGEIEWEYSGSDESPLLSTVGGCSHRLPGGNTLVIESTRGTAFEVTPSGEVVWEFASPHRAGDDEELVAFLPDVHRLNASDVSDWLKVDTK